MRRIYFLAPGTLTGKKVIDELLLAQLEWKHMRVIAGRGTPLEDLPEGSFWQKSDIVPAMLRAAPIGGATGLLCGLAAVALEPHVVLPDVPRDRVDEIEERVRKHLPDVEIDGTKPTIAAFPGINAQMRCT